jgi:hypothetical protein
MSMKKTARIPTHSVGMTEACGKQDLTTDEESRPLHLFMLYFTVVNPL